MRRPGVASGVGVRTRRIVSDLLNVEPMTGIEPAYSAWESVIMSRSDEPKPAGGGSVIKRWVGDTDGRSSISSGRLAVVTAHRRLIRVHIFWRSA